MERRCAWTVRRLITSSAAISGVVRPRATRTSTSISLGVRLPTATPADGDSADEVSASEGAAGLEPGPTGVPPDLGLQLQIGRASCREGEEISEEEVSR